jgi:chromosome segregation ATPase
MSESVAAAESVAEPVASPQPLGTLDSLTEFRSRRDEAPAEVVEAVEKPVVEAEKVEAEPDPASEAGKALAAKKGSLQSRIDELTREKKQAGSEVAALRARLEAIEAAQKPKVETPAKAETPGKPKAGDFENYEDFVEALADFKAEEKIRAEVAKQTGAAQQTAVERRQNEVRAKALEAHPDSDDVLQAFVDAGQVFHPAVSAAVLHEELGHEIAYAVAKDPALHAKIAQSPNPMVEIGRLIGRLEGAKEAPKAAVVVSKAPEPVKPVSGEGSSASGGFDPSKSNSVVEFRKNRDKL